MILEPRGDHVCDTPYRSHTEPVLSKGVGELPFAITYTLVSFSSYTLVKRVEITYEYTFSWKDLESSF